MRVGVIITEDAAGKRYVYDGAACTRLGTVDIASLKDSVDAMTVKGLVANVGKEKVPMTRCLLLTNNGLVKRRNLPQA